MAQDFLRDVLDKYIQDGHSDNTIWWDEERIPLDSIDKSLPDVMSLKGKKAVITGGAGINLGQACVNRLAGLGADVAVVDLPPAKAAEWQIAVGRKAGPDAQGVADLAAERWGTKTVAVYGDVFDWDSIQAVMAECNERLGGIDILVNSAVDTAIGPIESMSREDIDRAVNGTLVSPMYCSRVALDYMIPKGYGRIINVGSSAALTALPDLGMYGTLKAGLNAFTVRLGKEVARHGVLVNGVNPGSMWGPNRELLPDFWQTLYDHGRTAIQRYQLPEEVANMVAFLASDAASCMVGVMVDMGGGMPL